MPTEFNPQACSSRDVAEFLGVTLETVAKWVRAGCPCKPSGKARSALVFNVPQVNRWRYIQNAYQSGQEAGELAEKQVQIWDLELALEVGQKEASRILGYDIGQHDSVWKQRNFSEAII